MIKRGGEFFFKRLRTWSHSGWDPGRIVVWHAIDSRHSFRTTLDASFVLNLRLKTVQCPEPFVGPERYLDRIVFIMTSILILQNPVIMEETTKNIGSNITVTEIGRGSLWNLQNKWGDLLRYNLIQSKVNFFFFFECQKKLPLERTWKMSYSYKSNVTYE